MLVRLVLMLMCIAPAARVGAATPKAGDPAPPLTPETILHPQQTPSPTWDSLKGKAVVLEFWATWCGGCIEQIPHLNELADSFADRQVQFIWITPETPEKVSSFLKAHPISGMVALNPSGSQFDAYRAGLPTTVLVNPKGIIAGITHPQQLTETVLDDLAAGRPVKVTPPWMLMAMAAGAEPPTRLEQAQVLALEQMTWQPGRDWLAANRSKAVELATAAYYRCVSEKSDGETAQLRFGVYLRLSRTGKILEVIADTIVFFLSQEGESVAGINGALCRCMTEESRDAQLPEAPREDFWIQVGIAVRSGTPNYGAFKGSTWPG